MNGEENLWVILTALLLASCMGLVLYVTFEIPYDLEENQKINKFCNGVITEIKNYEDIFYCDNKLFSCNNDECFNVSFVRTFEGEEVAIREK